MTKLWALLGALGLALAGGIWISNTISSLRADLASTEASLALEQAKVAGYVEANRVLTSHLANVRAERDQWRQTAAQLEEKEGADEALNPYESSVLDWLRGLLPETSPAGNPG